MNQKQKDERQTKACDRLREFLRSMAVLSVQAQNEIGNPDVTSDLLDLIEHDLMMARSQVEILNNYDGE